LGLRQIDKALELAMETDYRWFVPEILRTKGELLALQGSDDAAHIEDLFRQSMSQAREQQALLLGAKGGNEPRGAFAEPT
jgi:non-specific serine/threonine protein kinase